MPLSGWVRSGSSSNGRRRNWKRRSAKWRRKTSSTTCPERLRKLTFLAATTDSPIHATLLFLQIPQT